MGERRTMDSVLLLQQIQEGIGKGAAASAVAAQPELVNALFEGIGSREASVKYGCDKVLRLLSREHPSVLYPSVDQFILLLDSENSFLKWGAIDVIAHLAAVDGDNKCDELLDHYLAPISGHVLITASNTIKGAALIAQAKPYLTDRVVQKLLTVEHAEYQTEECRNIALGQAIIAFDLLYPQMSERPSVVVFVRRQLTNSRVATRKKAAAFLRKHGE